MMPVISWGRSFALAPALVLGFSLSSAFADGFTAEQAEAGRTVYQAECGFCHGTRLEGTEAPGIYGQDVMGNWATAAGLYNYISVAMPPAAPGQLGEEAYVNIVAYIMEVNGAEPGDEPMTADPQQLASINLVEETREGAAAATANNQSGATDEPDTNVPQAFTWGKELPRYQP